VFFSFDGTTGYMTIRTKANADVATSKATSRGLTIECDATGRVVGVTTTHLDHYFDRTVITGIQGVLDVAERLFSAANDQRETEGV